jgi:hypothetical protein
MSSATYYVEPYRFGTYLIVAESESGLRRTVLVQTDWDFPGVASRLGWVACECGFTDGTVDCEHKKASDMIQDARLHLDASDGVPCDELADYFQGADHD